MERIPFPRLKGEFITVYRPKGDVYRGLPSFFFTPGSYYESWTVNDFSILNDGGHWHLTGITHPTPPDFVDDFHPGQSWHDAEHMLFHATAQGKTFADLMHDDAFTDCEKILYPKDRPDEIPECHAPHLLPDGEGGYRLFYGPRYMREAVTRDFVTFRRRVLFEDHPTARDPFVFEEDGLFYFLYAVENRVDYRSTRDFITFSAPKTLQVNPWRNLSGEGASCESPFLFKRKGYYYLVWSLWDDYAGVYDHRCFIFGAKSLEALAYTAPLTMLPAHAGEIYSDESGDYLLSAFYPANGISAAPLEWINED